MSSKVVLHVEGSMATITLNRPEVLNAFDSDTWASLEKVALDIISQPEIRVVILTGAGDRAFSTGLDLKALASGPIRAPIPHRNGIDLVAKLQQIFNMYDELPVPVVAAINGYCLGVGLELSLCCDIRIAAENAVFALPEVDLGIIPDMGGTQRLPKIVGPGHAKEIIYTARRINAAEALRIGLVNHVYPEEQLMKEAHGLADKIATKQPASVQAAKKAINVGTSAGLHTGLAYENALVANVVSEVKKVAGVEIT